jgi:hypothetical protein
MKTKEALLPKDVIEVGDPVIRIITEEVERLSEQEQVDIAIRFPLWVMRSNAFGSEEFTYSLRGLFNVRLDCFLATPYNLPYLPPEEEFEKPLGGIVNYFKTTPSTAKDFCIFKQVLAVESILLRIQNAGMENGLRTVDGIKEVVAQRQLSENVTNHILARAENAGYTLFKPTPLQERIEILRTTPVPTNPAKFRSPPSPPSPNPSASQSPIRS